MTLPSQPWLVRRSSRGADPPAKDVPPGASWRLQILVGWLPGTPSLFQRSHGVPSAATQRSEERPVGKECVSTCRSRWSPYTANKNIDKEYDRSETNSMISV